MTNATAATNSAPTSTPNDSPRLFDDDEATETTPEHMQQHLRQEDQTHNHIEKKPQSNSAERSPRQDPQQQSPDDNLATVTATPAAPTATITTTSSPTTPTTIATPADKQSQLEQSPSSHQQSTTNSSTNNNTEQKRPMNAFLLFCKRQRSLVREKYPNLENRGITKILGDWWSKLDKEQKSKYTDLARQHKEAFMKANPDFKWCKTPSVSNINNNVSINNAANESYNTTSNHSNQRQNQLLQRHQQSHHPATATNVELLSMQSIHHPMDIVHQSNNSMDIMLSRQQLEAPKPPKKRFLERNDSIYVTKSSFTSNHHDSNSHSTDVVPYISLDQDTLDRVIDKAFSEDSSNSPSGINTCKCSTRTSTNLTLSSGSSNPTSFSTSSTSVYKTNNDEPVDFSMNRTINTTRQQIINNLVEKMLSKPSDDGCSFSRMNATDSVKAGSRSPVKKDKPDDT